MSLGKLLATGRSLAGGPAVGRYNVSSVNRLPKFGSAKNPFAQPAAVAAPAQSAGVALAPAAPAPAIAPAVAPVVAAKPDAAVELKKTQRIAELVRPGRAKKWFAWVKVGAVLERLNFWKRRSQPSAFAKARPEQVRVAAPHPGPLPLRRGEGEEACPPTKTLAARGYAGLVWVKGFAVAGKNRSVALWGKLAGLCRKLTGRVRRNRSQSVFPRYGKPAVQTELSLDRVTVVRNDLEESDLEIVTAQTDTSTQVAPTVAPVAPKAARGPVPPALKKMTHRILGVKPS